MWQLQKRYWQTFKIVENQKWRDKAWNDSDEITDCFCFSCDIDSERVDILALG